MTQFQWATRTGCDRCGFTDDFVPPDGGPYWNAKMPAGWVRFPAVDERVGRMFDVPDMRRPVRQLDTTIHFK